MGSLLSGPPNFAGSRCPKYDSLMPSSSRHGEVPAAASGGRLLALHQHEAGGPVEWLVLLEQGQAGTRGAAPNGALSAVAEAHDDGGPRDAA